MGLTATMMTAGIMMQAPAASIPASAPSASQRKVNSDGDTHYNDEEAQAAW